MTFEMRASILNILVQIYNKGEGKISTLITQTILLALETVGTSPYGLEGPTRVVGWQRALGTCV